MRKPEKTGMLHAWRTGRGEGRTITVRLDAGVNSFGLLLYYAKKGLESELEKSQTKGYQTEIAIKGAETMLADVQKMEDFLDDRDTFCDGIKENELEVPRLTH